MVASQISSVLRNKIGLDMSHLGYLYRYRNEISLCLNIFVQICQYHVI